MPDEGELLVYFGHRQNPILHLPGDDDFVVGTNLVLGIALVLRQTIKFNSSVISIVNFQFAGRDCSCSSTDANN